jgi:aspartate carbamoyltransferase catalytic subunit
VREADVVIMLRIQRERQGLNFFPSIEEYARLFCLTRAALEHAAPGVVVLHPGPMNRGIEIASDVADGPYSVVMDQVTNGVAVRMAVLFLLVNRAPATSAVPEPATVEPPRLRRSVG